MDNLSHRLTSAFTARLVNVKQRLNNINIKSPKQVLMEKSQRLDDLGKTMSLIITTKMQNAHQKMVVFERFPNIMINRLVSLKQALGHIAQMLNSMSYKNVLQRGYAIVRDENNNIISTNTAKPASIEFADGVMNL